MRINGKEIIMPKPLDLFPLGEYGVNVIMRTQNGEFIGFPKVNYRISLPNEYSIFLTDIAPKFYIVNPSEFIIVEIGLARQKFRNSDVMTLRFSMKDFDIKNYYKLGDSYSYSLKLFPNGRYEDLSKVE